MAPEDIGLAQPMPDDPSDEAQPDLSGLSEADLAKALGDPVPVEGASEPPLPPPPDNDLVPEGVDRLEPLTPPPPPAPEPKAEAPVSEVSATQETAEVDPVEERLRIEREKYEARLALQNEHSSRLAGQIGDLKKKLSELPRPERDYSTDAGGLDDDTSRDLRARLAGLESQLQTEARDRAIAEEIAMFRARPELAEIQPDTWKAAAEKYASEWTQTLEIEDPKLARSTTKALLGLIGAEAREIVWSAKQTEAKRKSADQAARLKERKLASASVGSGQVAEATRKPRTLSEIPDADLDRLIDSNIASDR